VTSRERVLAALEHREPDRVPCDLGSTITSGIMAHALARLREHLGIKGRPPKVYDLFQMLGEVEMDIVERLGVDVLPIEPPVLKFGLRRDRYKPWTFWDGTEMLVPADFQVEVDEQGGYLLHHAGDPSLPVEGRMPRGGYYFDMPDTLSPRAGFEPPPLEQVRREGRLESFELEFMQARAEHLRRTTDKALMLSCWGKLGLPGVGSIPDWLMLLATDRAYVRELFEARTEVALENLERLKAAIGDGADLIAIDGTDYGSQKGELFNPEWFAELYVPFLRQQYEWVHRNTRLNPVQCSAAGMDPRWLKETFGDRLTFWGGGVDTQKTLPFGTPEQVAAEVEERIRIFAPGGGYVFNPVHNIQQGTPPENIVAAFDAARAAGRYPVA